MKETINKMKRMREDIHQWYIDKGFISKKIKETHITLHQKKKSEWKMGRRLEKTLLQRGHTDDK